MKLHNFPEKNLRPPLEFEILAAAVLKKNRSFINAYPETELTLRQTKKLTAMLQRRKSGEPIPYILGYKEFYGRNFLVNNAVLIPRPETEDLVAAVLQFTKGKNLSIIDVGTGSGCIATTLKLEQPKLQVFASDIDPRALAVAQKNAAFYNLDQEVNFLESNLLEQFDFKVDVIIANLPYIPTNNWRALPKAIRDFEPRLALDSGASKESLYRKLFAQAITRLNETGVIFYELDGDILEKDYSTLVAAG